MESLLTQAKSFPKIFHLGAPEIHSIFTGPVEITEKVDGSQIGFGKLADGNLIIRSKGREMYNQSIYQEQKLFKSSVNQILSVAELIQPGYFFYGEAVTSPKHNTLNYARTPKGFIALYGVLTPTGWVKDHKELSHYAEGLGIDVVPLIYSGEISNKDELNALLDRDSFLGNEKIEGFVVKNYGQSSTFQLSTECYGKFVREGFKERNGAKQVNHKDNILDLTTSFATEARWLKSVQHLRDDGKITNSPKDIGEIIQDVIKDLELEEKEHIKEQLYRFFIKQIKGGSVKGLPEWYKARLLEASVNVVPAPTP